MTAVLTDRAGLNQRASHSKSGGSTGSGNSEGCASKALGPLNCYEIPWDRVCHEAEPAYRHFRGTIARSMTTHSMGATIRKLREAKGLTQDQVATAVEMMRSNISRIEAAKHRPTLETLEKIAKALRILVADLAARRSS